ncbi:MAG TPA: hypothetical protein VKS79_02405 [Gemmataceae bacterium]|nr:hypothetical protein [Gemmataceae bacterium]
MKQTLLPILLLTLAAVAGCNRGAAPQPVTGNPSAPGWEIRYNATLALARRGSDEVKKNEQVWENLNEMLDEQQQLRNFRIKNKDGSEVSDEPAARMTVISALQAIDELHQRRPDMDLTGLLPAVEKLTSSSNVAVRTEATRTKLLLEKK